MLARVRISLLLWTVLSNAWAMSLVQLARSTKSSSDSASDSSADSTSDSSTDSDGESSSDSKSSRATDAGGSCPDDCEALRQEVKTFRRRHQTQKARDALREKRLRAKLTQDKLPRNEHPAAEYQADVFVDSGFELCKAGAPKPVRRRRLRLLWSWFTTLTSAIASLLRDREKDLRHVLNICVIDDTNMTLAPSRDGEFDKHGCPSNVVSVMNNIQTLVLRFSGEGDCEQPPDSYRTFLVHTPMCPLDRANASGIATEFVAWVMFWLGAVGQHWRRFNERLELPSSVPIQCLVISWDSLKTNTAVMKGLRQCVYARSLVDSSKHGAEQVFPLLSNRCAIHQLALIRKHSLFFFGGFWSTIVRLGHLYEIRSFRRHVKKAILQVVLRDFEHIRVHQLPADFEGWQREKASALFQSMDPKSNRYHLHQALSVVDNSETSSTKFIHWCTGSSCFCEGKPRKALVRMVQLYQRLFGNGFAVPLTYRWKHCDEAMAFCRDTFQHRSCCAYSVAYLVAGGTNGESFTMF